PLFRDIFAHSSPPRKSVTIAELIRRHRQTLANANNVAGTLKTYELPARLLSEVLGGNTRLDDITKDDAEKLLNLLRRVPPNAAKKYRGLTLEQAIKVAERKGDSARLANKTRKNYFNNLSAL